jgi:hypothetical protein
MSNNELDELGPVDYLVVEFPADKANFTGEIAAALTDLVDRGTVRVLDLLMLTKESDGSIDAVELSDLDESLAGELRKLETEVAHLPNEDDVAHLAAAMEPGTIAAALVWENSWAAPFGSAVRRAGGQLVASGRIPIQAILAAVEADAEAEQEGS